MWLLGSGQSGNESAISICIISGLDWSPHRLPTGFILLMFTFFFLSFPFYPFAEDWTQGCEDNILLLIYSSSLWLLLVLFLRLSLCRLDSNLRQSSSLCFPNAGTLAVHHHTQLLGPCVFEIKSSYYTQACLSVLCYPRWPCTCDPPLSALQVLGL